MKKRKISYDLTAQQKKQLKRQQENKDNNAKGNETVAMTDGTEAIDMQKRNKKSLIICVCAVALAVLMIVLAIGLPVWISSETVNNDTFLNWKNFNSKDPNNLFTSDNPNPNPPANPIATVTLTGDDKAAFKQVFGSEELKIDIELFIDDAKYSVMNFMYLAESKFYDNTIINDVNNQHAMFGGFTGTTTNSNKAREGSIVYNLKGFEEHINSNYNSKDFKLGYRLTAERSRNLASSSQSNLGYLVMIAGPSSYYSTSTSYMLLTAESQKLFFGDVNDNTGYNIESYLSWMGRVSPEYLDVITKFNDVQASANGNFLCPVNTIRISSIRTNLSDAKRKYLLNHFEELISDGLTSQWREINMSESYYKFDN